MLGNKLTVSALTFIIMAIVVTGCQYAGPKSIEMGRADYNSAIQNTSAQQVLANIVRVHDEQMPLVMDVTQINAALSMQGSVTPSIAGIGGVTALQGAGAVVPTSGTAGSISSKVVSGTTGAVGTSFSYGENPTITYTPLSGQPLIAQLSTPITVDSLAALPDSSWPLSGFMAMSINYLTLNYMDKDLALNAILELDEYGAVTGAATRSILSGSANNGVVGAPLQETGKSNNNPQQAANDSLVLYVLPQHAETDENGLDSREKILKLWIRMIKIYWETQPVDSKTPINISARQLDTIVACLNTHGNDPGCKGKNGKEKWEDYLNDTFRELPKSIEIRTMPVVQEQMSNCNAPLEKPAARGHTTCTSPSPVMRTRSALGVLRAAARPPNPLIEFVSPETYKTIREREWNKRTAWIDHQTPDFYTLLPEDEDSVNCTAAEKRKRGTDGWYSVGGCDNPDGEDTIAMTNFIACYVSHSMISSKASLFTMFPNDTIKDACIDKRYYTDGKTGNSDTWLGSPDNPSTAYLAESSLANLRRYVLVIQSDKSPQEALPAETPFVSFYSNGHWYFIANDDTVSKKNLSLISEFMSIMAIPAQAGQPAPTITVGR